MFAFTSLLLLCLAYPVPGYPKVICEMIVCPDPYMGKGVQPGAPPDPTLGEQDPYGLGEWNTKQ